MLRRVAVWAVLVSLLAATAGCGQKGPLYLPDGERDEQQRDEG